MMTKSLDKLNNKIMTVVDNRWSNSFSMSTSSLFSIKSCESDSTLRILIATYLGYLLAEDDYINSEMCGSDKEKAHEQNGYQVIQRFMKHDLYQLNGIKLRKKFLSVSKKATKNIDYQDPPKQPEF